MQTPAAIEALIQQGQWEEAEKQVSAMLAADPGGAEGLRWREEIRVLWTTSAVYLNASPTVEGELWVRRNWVGFRPIPEAGASLKPFQFRIDQIDPGVKKNMDWSLNQWGSYGTITLLLELKKPDGQKLLFALRDAGSMSRRIAVLRFKSVRPYPPPGLPIDGYAPEARGVHEMYFACDHISWKPFIGSSEESLVLREGS